ncbi:transporter substrate-binding domain-containing protein [Clostridium estertheticum]|uniref:transporter substrate-binding domain-containing protein n=1 Tax=Clostridium estertheticum TaxID=238834 RepID=UPI001CD0F510|nr:transporter substrate-binding domain-containing protein [Clostridium estertheticum]MBZ9688669.1 transporter substrate-binding domain-containing protein [Clostridium estertheticum]
MKNINSKKIISMIITILMAFSLSGCAQGKASAGLSKVDKIKEQGKIVIGTSADYPPYEFHKSIQGKDTIVGFDIEIAKEVAKDLGVKLEIKDMKFDGLLAALETGNIDFVAAGMTPTEDRKKNVDFSTIYYTAVQCVVIRAEDEGAIKSLGDLKGKKVGVQKGAVQEQLAKVQLTTSDIKPLGKVSDLMLSLSTKKVDAVIVELPVAKAYVKQNSSLALSKIQLKTGEEGSAVAVKKGNEDLVSSINTTITKLIKNKAIDKLVTDANSITE